MKIFCIGCSWTENWPDFIDKNKEVTKITMHGRGLPSIYNEMLTHNLDDYDYVVVQLPTPIRSFGPPKGNTKQYHVDFVNSFSTDGEDVACEKLLTLYKNDIFSINSLHKNVIMFLYNTGGYPLRHPFDFGTNIDNDFINFFKENNIKYVYLSFEGVPGYCIYEEECDDIEFRDYMEKNMRRMWKSGREYHDKLVWQHPDNFMIFDAHPNEKANRIAAEKIEELILDE